jgi:cell fate regulator YaaT (PSP1 superfamily)
MDDIQQQMEEPDLDHVSDLNDTTSFYRIRFRKDGQEFTSSTLLADVRVGKIVVVKTDHGNEPATIVGRAAGDVETKFDRLATYHIHRYASQDEMESYFRLPELEKDAYDFCQAQVDYLDLPMNLVRVERFFNGSKIIFYFTAENRVDFRELVKLLVQEYRTRVEMRQIGVRHETQMIGGLGSCGRELCCSSFLKKFESVSIKMAKMQDLPLNPAKISGVCNRLLCCLTYEYDTYRSVKKGMPRVGKLIRIGDEVYKVARQVPLGGEIIGISNQGEERVFSEEEWRSAEVVQKSHSRREKKGTESDKTSQNKNEK